MRELLLCPRVARSCLTALCWMLGASLLLGSARADAQETVLNDFESGVEPWTVMGPGSATRVSDTASVRRGKGAMAYQYNVAEGSVQVLVRPVAVKSLAQASEFRLSIKTSHLSTLLLSLEEQGGGRWAASMVVSPGEWNDLRIPVDSFMLARGKDDPADPNGRLDLDRVRQMSVVDAQAMLVAGAGNMARMFGIPTGSRRVLMDDLGFVRGGAGADKAGVAAGGVQRIDRLMQPGYGSMAFGVQDLRRLKVQGVDVTELGYRKGSGLVMSWMQPITPGTLSGLEAFRLKVGSTMKTELVFKVEQANGDKFETTIPVAAHDGLQELTVKLQDLKRSDDSGSRNDKVQAAEISQVILVDVGGWFASKGDNRLRLGALSAVLPAGGAPAASRSMGAPEASVAVQAVKTTGWSTWSKRVQPIYSGPYSLVGDPSVIKDGALYRMAYTCYDPKRKGPAMCQATSPDGLDWTDVKVPGPIPGLMVQARPGKWDDAHETPYLYKHGDTYFLYFVGYRDKGGFAKSFPAFLGLATSKDGVNFERQDEPVLKPTPGGYDNEAVFSPSIVEYQGELVMIYTGHCWTNCPNGKGVFLLAATSKDGRQWVKRPKPILDKAQLPSQVKDGAAESEIVRGPDGQYYLFMSWLYGDSVHEIGVARSATPFGPWEINAQPIVKRPEGRGFDDVGPIAPSVLIEGGKVRMWFHGFSKRKSIEIGYAEAPWPLKSAP